MIQALQTGRDLQWIFKTNRTLTNNKGSIIGNKCRKLEVILTNLKHQALISCYLDMTINHHHRWISCLSKQLADKATQACKICSSMFWSTYQSTNKFKRWIPQTCTSSRSIHKSIIISYVSKPNRTKLEYWDYREISKTEISSLRGTFLSIWPILSSFKTWTTMMKMFP